MLRVCARGILRETDYSALELLVLDNGSIEPETADFFRELQADPRVRILALPGPFNFSALNNAGAAQARGEILLFLNNDVEVIEPDWLREMVSQALRPGIGCVGAKLLYTDRTIQHAGIVLQADPLAMHVFRTQHWQELGPDANLAGVRGYLAVTAACMAMRRKLFDAVGGFDEDHLKVAYNDVDLCLRVDEAGYRNVCSPFAMLLHRESATRSADSSLARQETDRKEQACLLARWVDRFERDPFGHPRIRLDWNEGARLLPLPLAWTKQWNTLAR
jgi:GT2 family glycosyltransferase